MSKFWGAYGAALAQPKVAIALMIASSVLCTGIICGSRMWEAELLSEVKDLWINPNSEPAEANRIIDLYGTKAFDTVTEVSLATIRHLV
jgi:hypothetical protein